MNNELYTNLFNYFYSVTKYKKYFTEMKELFALYLQMMRVGTCRFGDHSTELSKENMLFLNIMV